MNSSGEIIREPKPITRDVLLRRHDLAPSDLHRLQRICAGIEGIEIKLSFPRKTDDVYLITTEDIR